MSQLDTESERRYRALFENPFGVIAVLDAVRDSEAAIIDWRYCDANTNWLRMQDRPREQVLGKAVTELMPERAAELIPLYTRVLAQSRPQQYEEHSGETDLLISLFPIGPDSIVTSGVDISARIRVEAEVRRLLEANRAEREWLSAVLNSLTQEVYFADTQKRYTYANPAALREFGHDTVEGVDIEKIVSHLEVLRPDGTPRPFAEAPPVRALAGETVRDEEQMVRTPLTGQLRYRQVSSAPVRDGNGRIIGSVSVVRDVTDKRLREKELREAERRRKKLIATLAHELRNPLAPLRTGIELLRKVREQPQLLDTVPPMMERQIRQLVALIDRLLDTFEEAPTH
ncbi:MAG TPA: PAS domain-containing protein [Steroidobacteraceae bacterium]|jgi:PAS domain S-box-containing protein|nr:PAS domain-containing protein [Steroidobacteraceae bacterium]